MPSYRDRDDYAKNVSKRHKLVGRVLSQGCFKHYKVYQEVSISDINSNYSNHKAKADWYIPDLHVVIEVHGEQHFKPVDFGGEGMHKAKLRFVRGQHLDVEKVMALAEVGIGVVEIAPNDPIDEKTLAELISKTMKQMTTPSASRFKKGSKKLDRAKKQARQNRKDYYRKMKAKAREERD